MTQNLEPKRPELGSPALTVNEGEKPLVGSYPPPQTNPGPDNPAVNPGVVTDQTGAQPEPVQVPQPTPPRPERVEDQDPMHDNAGGLGGGGLAGSASADPTDPQPTHHDASRS